EGTLASRTRTNDAPPTPELRDKRPRCDDDRACLETAFNPCMPALLPPPHVTPVAATTAPHPVADANAMLADFVSYLRVGRSARGHAVDLKVGAGRAAGLRVRLESDGNAIDAVLDADDAHPEDVRHVRDALERGLSARGLTLRSIEVRGE
ncbi:MAG: hypothetical protein KC417_16040, partial [Myxococcales bacterium]|nr:hypothetical protein [Myxococcales bacterium]